MTLQALQALEVATGNIFARAEDLLQNRITPAEAARLLTIAAENGYKAKTLAAALHRMIAFLTRLGAVKRGSDGVKRADLALPRKFFMGVLGWPPDIVWRAGLEDLEDAFFGYVEFHNLIPQHPARRDMAGMMQKFPDEGEK